MSTLTLHHLDHSFAQLGGDRDAIAELSDHLTFKAPGADFDPRVKSGKWDGMLRLVHWRDKTVHAGLEERIRDFCSRSGIELRSDLPHDPPLGRWYGTEAVEELVRTVGLPPEFVVRDYQLEALRVAVSSGRRLFVSPTSSGKSLIIHLVARWYDVNTLIVVPSVGLISQFRDDLVSYGFDPGRISTIGAGVHPLPEYPHRQVVISTWQSLVDLETEWFDQFGLVIGDEAHRFAAKSLIGIMDKTGGVPFRFGFTGTLSEAKCHQLQLEGLFGPTTVVTTTRELMDRGYVADMSITAIVLSHPREHREELTRLQDEARKRKRGNTGAIRYAAETRFLYECGRRNRFIVKLVTKLPGNSLVLFHQIEHGDRLHDMIVTESNRPVHLINGGVDGLERNDIRGLIEASDDAILLASVGTTSTGVSIRRINNLVLASPWKSQIVTLQSLGRGLRMAEDKVHVDVYDIADDLTIGGRQNHTIKHMAERVRIYCEQDFDYKVVKIDL